MASMGATATLAGTFVATSAELFRYSFKFLAKRALELLTQKVNPTQCLNLIIYDPMKIICFPVSIY